MSVCCREKWEDLSGKLGADFDLSECVKRSDVSVLCKCACCVWVCALAVFSQDLVRAAESLFDGLFKKGPRAPAASAAPPARTGGSWWVKDGGEAPWYPKAWQPRSGGAWGKGGKRHGQSEGAEGKSRWFVLSRWPFSAGCLFGPGQPAPKAQRTLRFVCVVCVHRYCVCVAGTSGFQGKCNKCGEFGHMKKDCPKKDGPPNSE